MNDTVKVSILPPPHPLAGQTMTGAQMIVQVIADQGLTALFGYSGGAILPTYDAVFLYNAACQREGRPQLPLIVPANEQGAGFMAAGYSRATGQVGVALVTSGPGATNMVTPVRDCMADSVPMVVICGQVPRAAIGSDAFHADPKPRARRALSAYDGVARARADGVAERVGKDSRGARGKRPGGGRCAQGRAELAGLL